MSITLTHSPSSLALARDCKRSWALRYLHKIYPEQDYTRGKTLGVLIHRCLELYLRGGKLTDLTYNDLGDGKKDVDGYYATRIAWHRSRPLAGGEITQAGAEQLAAEDIATLFREAPQRALAGLDYLPKPEQVYWHNVEAEASILTTLGDITPSVIPHKFSQRSRIDWVGTVRDEPGVDHEGVLIIDHKSTAGKKGDPWCYIPDDATLLTDPQFIVYATSVMQRARVRKVVFRWIYYYTGEGPAQATKRELTATWEHCAEQMRAVWLPLCDELQALADEHNRQPINVGQLPPPADLTSQQSPCKKYRGCPHKGVRCEPPVIPLSQLVANFKAPQEKETNIVMNQPQQPASIANMLAGSLPVQPAQPLHVAPPGYAHAVPVAQAPTFYPQAPVAPMTPEAVATPSQPYGQPLPAADVVVGGPAHVIPSQQVAVAHIPAHITSAMPAEYVTADVPPGPEKAKRTRRTRAQIEADNGRGTTGCPAGEVGVAGPTGHDPGVLGAVLDAHDPDFGTRGAVPTLHTSDPLEALLWAVRNNGGKVTVTIEVSK